MLLLSAGNGDHLPRSKGLHLRLSPRRASRQRSRRTQNRLLLLPLNRMMRTILSEDLHGMLRVKHRRMLQTSISRGGGSGQGAGGCLEGVTTLRILEGRRCTKRFGAALSSTRHLKLRRFSVSAMDCRHIASRLGRTARHRQSAAIT